MNKKTVLLSFGLVSALFLAGLFTSSVVSAANTNSVHLQRSLDQSLFISDANQTGLNLQPGFTIESWVKFATPAATGHTIVSKYNFAPFGRAFNLTYDPQGLTLAVFSPSGPNDAHYLVIPYTFPTNEWHHLAVSYSVSGTATFYVDGANVGSASGGPTSMNVTPAAFRIGNIDAGVFPDDSIDGFVDEVRVWSVERTASEIASNYQIDIPGNTPGLVGYWHLNGNLVDSSQKNNGLTASNGASFSSDVWNPAPPVQVAVRKSVDESLSNSIVPQNDDQLIAGLIAGQTYEVEGVIFATASNANPDLRIAFTAPAGSDMNIGYISASGSVTSGGVLQSSGVSSTRIPLPANTVVPINVKGTIVATNGGNLQLQWAQFANNNATVKVIKGSNLHVSPI